ncbi:YciI family protein [Streptomyces sp. 372A]
MHEMAKYLLLIHGDEQIWESMTEQDRMELGAAHAAFTAAAGDAVLSGHELLPTTTAKTLRGSVSGRPTPTDGPFLEAEEALGGYYVWRRPTWTRPSRWPSGCPRWRWGTAGTRSARSTSRARARRDVTEETGGADVTEAVARAHRREWAGVLAATVRVTRDLGLAEECARDAYAQALRKWAASGVPERPGAWLTTVARNRAKDILRRESVLRSALPLLVMDDVVPGPRYGEDSSSRAGIVVSRR